MNLKEKLLNNSVKNRNKTKINYGLDNDKPNKIKNIITKTYNKNNMTNLNINTTIDEYFLSPYQYNPKHNNNKENIEIIKNESKDLASIISNLTNLVLNKNKDDKNKKNNDEKEFNPLLFKLVANDSIQELEKSLKFNKNINVNEQDKDGDTPLHISVFLSNVKCIRLLLKNGADITKQDKWGQTALHRICFSMGEERTIEILELFESINKINIKKSQKNIFNLQDNYGNTVCHLIIKHIIKNKTVLNQYHKKLIQKLKSLTNNQLKNIDGHTIQDLFQILEKNKIL